MNENSVKKLQALGQSVWLDNLSRNLLNSGQLQKLIDDGITGITSNPTIFQKAIAGSRDYDDSLRVSLAKGIQDDRELFFRLAIEDISRAADLLEPVYQSTGGRDGYVSIEVSPDLAYDTEKTIAEARHLFSAINKKNLLVKVPATPPGVPAIERLTAEGVNVNVTLLFSVKRYEEVARAYIQGLENRVARSLPIGEIASVASFFVSRVDTLVDKLLEARQASSRSESEKGKLKSLLGRAAVANARIAYKKYREIFAGPKFQALRGARVQRILWGSSGTKNPAYSDVKYVDELIGPDSINTVPEATLEAFRDHGQLRITVEDNLAEAEKLFRELAAFQIDIEQVAGQLEKEGVKLFADSFDSLLKDIGEKKNALKSPKA
jgi:transaldolase